MNFFLYRWSPCYQFRALEWLISIGKLSLKPQEANELKILPWIALELGFQNSLFFTKTQVLFPMYGTACSQWARGFLCLYMYEWFRVVSCPRNQRIDVWIFDFLWQNIFKSFHAHLLSIISNPSLIDHARILSVQWEYFLHKKILFH